MVDEDQPSLRGVHDVVSGNIAEKLLVLIDDRVGPVTVSQHFYADILCQLIGVEENRIFFHDAFDRRCEVKITRGIHRAMPGADDRAVMLFCLFDDGLIDSIRPYDDQHSGTELNAFFLCHRICADDDDPFLDLIAVEVFRISHGDNADFAVDCDVRIVIDNTSVDCFSDVFNRCVRQNVDGPGGIIESDNGEIGFCDHAEHVVPGIDDAAVGEVFLLHDLHGFVDRGFRRDGDRWIHGDLRKLHPRIL